MRIYKHPYSDRNGRDRETRKWYGEFTHEGAVRRTPLFTDRKASEECGRMIERLAALRAAHVDPDMEVTRWLEHLDADVRRRLAKIGLIDARRAAASKLLTEHLDDYAEASRSKGNTEKHVAMSETRAKTIIEGCRFRRWSDISASRIQSYLARLPHGTATRNHYLVAFKSFCHWMVLERRASESPVAHLRAWNACTDKRVNRRVLSADECRWLLQATAASKEMLNGITGPKRAMLYNLALNTGLRWSELKSLTHGSFDLDADPPTVTVGAAYSKHGREDTLPLRQDIAAALRKHLATTLPNAKAFPMWQARGAEMLRRDLHRARCAWVMEAKTWHERKARARTKFLCYKDEAGRVRDFHALRHSFISSLALGGVHPKTAQSLARHSTITLTMDRYTHIALSSLTEALDVLPDLSAPANAAAGKSRVG